VAGSVLEALDAAIQKLEQHLRQKEWEQEYKQQLAKSTPAWLSAAIKHTAAITAGLSSALLFFLALAYAQQNEQSLDIVKEDSLFAKKIVLDFVQQYETEPKLAEATLQEMVENLEGLDAGPNAENVTQILEVVRELMANYELAGQGKVAELLKLADQIPGDVSQLGPEGE
jgi:hypothetical protein